MASETAIDLPDIKNAHDVLLQSRYRIGDAIAVMLMASLIDNACGHHKQWIAAHGVGLLGKFAMYKPTDKHGPRIASLDYAVNLLPRDMGTALPFPDDGRLWIWNDVCHTLGHRLDFTPTKQRPYRIVFAPLWEADYAAERCLHPYFVRDLAQQLAQHEDAVLLLPERFNLHDLALVRTNPITKIHASLSEAIEIIGNAELFIGGDTGLSHIAGMFPNVKQIALNDRMNTLRHVEREFDHMKENREFVLGICEQIEIDVTDAQYRSFPNKRPELGCRTILFDNGGQDGVTLKTVIHAMGELL